MFGFTRIAVVLVGAAVLAIGTLHQYVGPGVGEDILQRVPAADLIREHPGLAGMVGVLLIIIAFVYPSDGWRLNDQ